MTLGVVEPFTTAVKVSLAVAIAVTLPVTALPALGVPRAGARGEHSADGGRLRHVRDRALRDRRRLLVLRRHAACALSFLTNFNEDVFQVQIRASYYFSFVTLTMLATGLAFQMPIFILALVRLRILTAAKLRRNRRLGIAAMLVFAILLPTVDPVSLALEFFPLLFLFEFSIWLASFMEKRWELVDEPSRWAVE